MRTAIATRVSGEMVRHAGKAYTFMRMEAGISENSMQITKMVLVGKSGQMGRCLKDSSGMERSMAKVILCGQTAAGMSASLTITRSAEREPTHGLTIACTRVLGRTTKWMEWGYFPGQMDASISGSIVMTTSTETESSYGPMESVTKDSGARAFNTV